MHTKVLKKAARTDGDPEEAIRRGNHTKGGTQKSSHKQLGAPHGATPRRLAETGTCAVSETATAASCAGAPANPFCPLPAPLLCHKPTQSVTRLTFTRKPP